MRLEMAIVLMILIDISLFLTQTAIINVAASESIVAPTAMYDYQSSYLKNLDTGNYTLNNNATGLLPAGQGEVVPNTGNFFTDGFQTIKNFFMDTLGLKYFVSVVTAVPNLLSHMGLPPEIAFAIGAIWHLMTLVLIVAWMFGR